jgi:hypothetical protein
VVISNTVAFKRGQMSGIAGGSSKLKYLFDNKKEDAKSG